MNNYHLSILALTLLSILVLIGCDKGEVYNKGTDKECAWNYSCDPFDFSLVNNQDFDENLVGTDGQLVHPDSIVITNSRKDTMYHEIFTYPFGWATISHFSVYQELTCFNPCLLDSAFTRTYYMYLGNGDTDTLEVFFPEHTQIPEVFFNGLPGWSRDLDLPDYHGPGLTQFYLRKDIN